MIDRGASPAQAATAQSLLGISLIIGRVLAGYLIGLGVTQYAIAVGVGRLAVRLWHATESTAMAARLAGAAVAGAGALLTLEHLEGAVLGALGIG